MLKIIRPTADIQLASLTCDDLICELEDEIGIHHVSPRRTSDGIEIVERSVTVSIDSEAECIPRRLTGTIWCSTTCVEWQADLVDHRIKLAGRNLIHAVRHGANDADLSDACERLEREIDSEQMDVYEYMIGDKE